MFDTPRDPATDPERRRAAYRRSLKKVKREAEKLPAWMKMTPDEYAKWLALPWKERATTEAKAKVVERERKTK